MTFSAVREQSPRVIFQRLMSDRGSATIEFVALALPLFLPLFLFLNQYATQSDLEGSLKTLAREMARAAVTSENDRIADAVAEEVFIRGGDALGLGKKIENGEIRFTMICRESPCISPENEVQVVIATSELPHLVTAVEYVSPWA